MALYQVWFQFTRRGPISLVYGCTMLTADFPGRVRRLLLLLGGLHFLHLRSPRGTLQVQTVVSYSVVYLHLLYLHLLYLHLLCLHSVVSTLQCPVIYFSPTLQPHRPGQAGGNLPWSRQSSSPA